MVWVFIVIFLFEIGAIAWLIAGRPQAWQRSMPSKGNTDIPPEYDRPWARAAPARTESEASSLLTRPPQRDATPRAEDLNAED